MHDGDGLLGIRFKDTRLLTDAERAVLAGVVKTRGGINTRFHDRLAALLALAKRVGFYNPVDDRSANDVARALQELKARGQMQRMPLRRQREPGE